MAILLRYVVFSFLFQNIRSDELVKKNVQPCEATADVDKCLGGKAVEAMNNAIDGKIRELGIRKSTLDDYINNEVMSPRADSMLRTFNRAWKYLIPGMIGILLKLATFVPMVLTVLTLIAKSAFLSGHLALFLTGLNVALKWWSPKWAAESVLEQHGYDLSHHTNHHHDGEGFADPYKNLAHRRVVYLRNRR